MFQLFGDSQCHDADLNDCNRPVLKHGPRSLTYVQVFEWLKLRRAMKVKAFFMLAEVPHFVLINRISALTDHFLVKEI